MSALPAKPQPSSGTRTQPGESLVNDAVLARLVQQGLRDVARHSCAYAAVFANKPGARLAHHVTVGYVDQLTESGRRTLADLYRFTQAALTVEPGLDTNTLVDRVTGRRDTRRDPEGRAREIDWSTTNPDDYLVEFGHRTQGLGVAAEHPGRILAGLDRAVPSQPLVDPLSPREMQVLKLLDSELSAPEVKTAGQRPCSDPETGVGMAVSMQSDFSSLSSSPTGPGEPRRAGSRSSAASNDTRTSAELETHLRWALGDSTLVATSSTRPAVSSRPGEAVPARRSRQAGWPRSSRRRLP